MYVAQCLENNEEKVYHLHSCVGMSLSPLVLCRPFSLALYTANRIYELVADNGAEMHMWIGALSPKKFSQGDDDLLTNCIYKGLN